MKKEFVFVLIFCAACFCAASLFCAETEGRIYGVYDLWNEIKNKAVAFEFDETLRVKGIVVETGISVYATPYVSLSNEKEGTVYATCVLPRSDVFKLSAFKKGDEVSMKGSYYTFVDKAVIKKCTKEEEGK